MRLGNRIRIERVIMSTSTEDQIMVARRIFHKMPDKLFDIYIKQFILQVGNWPFTSVTDSTTHTKWFQLFCVVPLYDQAMCGWEYKSITPSFSNISNESLADIRQTLELKVRDDGYSRKSSEYQIQQLKTFGSFSLPVVLYPMFDRFFVLDGVHRVGAALSLSAETGRQYSIPAWIAHV